MGRGRTRATGMHSLQVISSAPNSSAAFVAPNSHNRTRTNTTTTTLQHALLCSLDNKLNQLPVPTPTLAPAVPLFLPLTLTDAAVSVSGPVSVVKAKPTIATGTRTGLPRRITPPMATLKTPRFSPLSESAFAERPFCHDASIRPLDREWTAGVAGNATAATATTTWAIEKDTGKVSPLDTSGKTFQLTRRESEPLPRSPTSTMMIETTLPKPTQRMALPMPAETETTSFTAPGPTPTPGPGTAVPTRRRLIFSSFWESSLNVPLLKSESMDVSESRRSVPKPASAAAAAANTLFAVPPLSSPHAVRRSSLSMDIRQLSSLDETPPAQRWQRVSQRSSPHATFLWLVQDHLPTLPSPLQRLRRHTGVYPLVQPPSILRRRQKQPTNKINNSNNGTASCSNSRCSTPTMSNVQTITAGTSGNGTGTSTTLKKARVNFDPRITVTALADTNHKRQWYTDTELEGFRLETTQVARTYLCQNPHQIAYYRDTFLDPVTKTRRHRPLFGLPALSGDTTEEDDDADVQQHRLRELLTALATFCCRDEVVDNNASKQSSTTSAGRKTNADIQRILIVDRNPRMLDLMHRSVQTMYKHDACHHDTVVEIECVSSVSEARHRLQRTVSSSQRPFDVVICDADPPKRADEEEEEGDLARWINNNSCNGILLLIGVTNQQAIETMPKEAGFDFVWGRPPPRMDSCLRVELVQALRRKRDQARCS